MGIGVIGLGCLITYAIHYTLFIFNQQTKVKGNIMAYYSTFKFQLLGCPEIWLSTRYDCIQTFESMRAFYKPGRQMPTTQSTKDQLRERWTSRVTLTKWQRRKIQTFLNVIYRSGIHKIPRKYRKFIKDDGVFPQEAFDNR